MTGIHQANRTLLSSLRKKSLLRATLPMVVATASALTASAASNPDRDDYSYTQVPTRAIVLMGDSTGVQPEVMTVLYDTQDLHFRDPGLPRFLLIDREGTTVLGIGGAVEGVVSYDFMGSINNDGFETFDIPVPRDPAMRSRLAASATHSSLFLKLVRQTGIGVLTAYVQSNFSGGETGYGFKLKQAYVSLDKLTLGLTNSTFVDPQAGVPTIDYQGPSGEMTSKNIIARFRTSLSPNFTMAVSAEIPQLTLTTGTSAEAISQRVPDIPAYIQYAWGGGNSHLRLSGIFRDLYYRDLVKGDNRSTVGWGVQLSGMAKIGKPFTLYYQGTYGKGIGHYLNDLDGNDLDLIPSSTDGKLTAPGMAGFVGGLRVDITPKFFFSGSYSLCRLYGQREGHMDPSTYRRGNYAVANVFYSPLPEFLVGLEYLHGSRTDMSRISNSANRIECMLKYSF